MLCKSLSHYPAILTAEEPRDEIKMQAVMELATRLRQVRRDEK